MCVTPAPDVLLFPRQLTCINRTTDVRYPSSYRSLFHLPARWRERPKATSPRCLTSTCLRAPTRPTSRTNSRPSRLTLAPLYAAVGRRRRHLGAEAGASNAMFVRQVCAERRIVYVAAWAVGARLTAYGYGPSRYLATGGLGLRQ